LNCAPTEQLCGMLLGQLENQVDGRNGPAHFLVVLKGSIRHNGNVEPF
jgi:hypothetical protein